MVMYNLSDDLFFSYVSFEDVKRSCIMQQTEKRFFSFDDKNNDDMHTLKLFVKSYFESLSSGVNDLLLKVQEIADHQNDLNHRMKKLELFSETTADELLKYYIEVFKDVERNPDEIRNVFINGLGKNNVIILMKKIQEYIELQFPQEKKLVDKISYLIEVLDNDKTTHAKLNETIATTP